MGQFFKMFFAALLAGIVLMVLPFMVFIGFVSAISSSMNSEPPVVVKQSSALVIDLSAPIMDKAVEDPMAIFTSFSAMAGDIAKPISLRELTEAIARAKDDDKIEGIVFEGEGFGGGLAQLEAIRKAVLDFKESGKFVVSYANLYGQGDYALKSAGTHLFLNPNGMIDVKGLSMTNMFYKGFEDKYGVEVQVFRVGKFKSAVEPFLADKMSEANRLQSRELITTVWDTLSSAMAASRGWTGEQMDYIAANRVGYSASGALENGMVDSLMYENQFRDFVKDSLGAENRVKYSDYVRYMPVPKDGKKSPAPKDRIAVIYAQGEIVYGKGQASQISEKAMRKAFDKAAKSDRVKAVVLRVNSPGGAALTADNIWKMVEDIKKDKPVVVSMGNYAASGGYYISCNADYIFAEPTTLTGSIGVFGYVPNIKKLAAGHGITTDAVSTYPNSADPTFFTPVSDGLGRIIQKSVEETYAQFLSRVADGRGMSVAAVDSIAQGRVWSGVSALKIGLVDELGGMDDALEKAAELAGLEDYSVDEYPKFPSSMDQLLEMLGGGQKTDDARVRALVGDDMFQMYKAARDASQVKEARVMARVPYGMRLEF